MSLLSPPVTIVITTFNLYSCTRWMIESITATLDSSDYEIVIVDDGSTDETRHLRKHYRFLETGGAGLYAAWNKGIEAAETQHVLVCNNDLAFCTRDWWRWLHQALATTDAKFVYPHLIEQQSPCNELYHVTAEADAMSDLVLEDTYGRIEAACFALDKALVDEIGPFDADFKMWYGEKDYEIRLAAAGVRYTRVKNAVVRHYSSSTLSHGLPERDFAFDLPRSPRLDAVVRKDYEIFKAKHSAASLEPLGFTFPEFGRHPLGRADAEPPWRQAADA
ncbi:glycosyltransferase family 2 protein [Amycolatopsis sp. NPDC049868]|uniref:glycosyltransferase family 2 protein n=1 Tax=Amycolatopsis sp. NPDC049868 TaxID=3363934 RepID=UPI0037A23592